MLQQTQVARVVPRYLEWLERWPTAAALAAASRAEVLAAWVGLGYNRRALALHAAAAAVARDGWPDDLRTLPGVGPYTAAAVASFAFGAQVAAVDTNARRVAERLGHGAPDALVPPGRAARLEPGRDGARRDRLHGAGAAVRRLPGRAVVRVGRPSGRACGARPARRSERFEDSNRWVRGRVVAALAKGEGLPADIAAERVERALAGLVRDGLVRPVDGGFSLG